MCNFKLLAVLFLALLVLGCNDDENPSPVPDTSNGITTIADSLYVPSREIFKADVNEDGISDFMITPNWNYSQTWNEYHFKVTRLNTQTIIHAIAAAQDLCNDSVVTNGFAGVVIKNCDTGLTYLSTVNYNGVINLDSANLLNTTVSDAGTDTLLLQYGYTSYGMPYPNFIFASCYYGFFSKRYFGYMLLSVGRERYAYKISFVMPYLIIESKQKL